jgi:D-alanyl-D-alanine carboxypeptidase (penicillin-binding protein 5/6)
MRRFLLTCAVLLAAASGVLAAPAPANGFETEADQAILLDAETGAVLFEKKADVLFAPASMSKLMTLAVLFRKLKAGEISQQTEFPVSQYAWRTGGAPSRTSAMFAPLNSTVTVGDLMQGIAVQIANDGCIVVAEGLAGSEAAFVEKMTEEARALGLTKSTFGNSTGLPHPDNKMTARELAQLALHIIREYKDFYPVFAQKEFKFRSHTFRNLNPLIAANGGVDGLMVGFAEGAGFGVVASATRDNRRLIMVMNGFDTVKDRKEEALKFLNWGFGNFRAYKVFASGDVAGQVRVWGGDKRRMDVKVLADVKIPLPINAKDRQIETKIVYKGPVKTPIKEGDRIGDLVVTSQAGTSNTVPVYAGESLEAAGMVRKGLDTIVFELDAFVSTTVKRVFKKQT